MWTYTTSALLLLASATMAQVATPSVVTFISMSPVPTTDGVFTIQTSLPSLSITPCVNVCTQAPCRPCAPVTSEGSMGILPGETPIPSSVLASASVLPSPGGNSTTFSRGTPTASSSGSSTPQPSTGASPSLQSDGTPLKLAVIVSAVSLLGAALAFL